VLKASSENKKGLALGLILFCALFPLLASSQELEQAVISIIIDDIGYHNSDSQMIDLPGNLTFAILPNGPKAMQLAEYAHQQGKELMLHMPMQSTLGLAAEVGVLNIDMQEKEVVASIRQAFAKVPYAIGLNNHQGSLLTRHPGHMSWVMKELQEKGYYFVDSRTSKQSIAEQVAKEHGVSAIRRDVFLDHDINEASIKERFDYLVKVALKKGHAVAIGHPHPETLAVLKELLPSLVEKGVRLEPISYQLWKRFESKGVLRGKIKLLK